MSLPSFVFNDQSKCNSHGFYLLNSGGQFERFTQNPVMLDNHNLDRLIGLWNNLRIEGDLLKADPEFDEGTELGRERKGQVERGFLRGASPGIIILEAEYRHNIATGKDDLYVTKWDLLETSTTPLPSNAGAISLRVYSQDRQLIPDKDVKLHLENIIRLSAGSKAPGGNLKIKNMDKITLTAEAYVALGIKGEADPTAISAAIVKLHGDLKGATQRVTTLEAEKNAEQKKKAENLIKLAIEKGQITADMRDAYTELAVQNYDLAQKTIKAIPEKVSLSNVINPIANVSGIPAGREKWTHLHWLKEDPEGLAKIKAESPDMFEAIKKIRN